MSLRFYNTLSRRVEDFAPLAPPLVKLYTCGPTVYDFAHIGNFRAYLFEDLLRRHLKYRGFHVLQVMNLTDVDDKTIRGARSAGVALADYTRAYKEAFFEDLRRLNIEPAEHYPAATDHIPEMIALIEKLFQKGCAYKSDDGSVYFSIAKFSAYGRLAHLDLSGLRAGARVAQDEYQKENVADFALWKAWQVDDGDVAWDSPWGRGRPGWHIECSAMSMKYLGPSFDVHTGGIDNIFPHHEDEIAQSEAATGRQFVKYWLHCAHLVVEGKKMSKSLGNFYTLRDVLAKGFSGREVRYALMTAQYRQALNFSFEVLEAARAALQRLDEFSSRLRATLQAWQAGNPAGTIVNREPPGRTRPCETINEAKWWTQACRAFGEALDDDLNLPVALASLFEIVHEGNRRLAAGPMTPEEAAAILGILDECDRVLGFLQGDPHQADSETIRLAEARQAARHAKQWAEADRLRQAILARGWMVQDGAGGYQLKRTGAV